MDNFIDQYMVYTSGNEVPKAYHQWAAIGALSALVGRKVWVNQGMMARIFPNVYIALVGDPASGKSTALSLARSLLQAIGNVNMAPTSTTVEAMLKNMGSKDSPLVKNFPLPNMSVVTYTPLHINASELTTFFGGSPDKMIAFLTDIWDLEIFENDTKNKGADYIRGPYITLLGCMTPSTVDSMCRAKMITGGFTRRVFFIDGGKRETAIPRPGKTAEEINARETCIRMGKKIQGLAGEFVWTRPGEVFFDNWYINVKHPRMLAETDPVMSRWYTAKDVLLLKVTMLLEIAKEKPVLEITEDGLRKSLELIDSMESKIPGILGGAGRNVHAAIAQRVLKYIVDKGNAVTEKELIAAFYGEVQVEEIMAILNFLTQTDQLKSTTVRVGNLNKSGYAVVAPSKHPVAAKVAKLPD